jgi:hypothetical protein
MTPIFITSWNRPEFTRRVINEIQNRTEVGTYSIHVLDNGSEKSTRVWLSHLQTSGEIDGLTLLKSNSACVHPKHVFSALVPDSCPYFVVTDNDFIPGNGWLPKMLEEIERNPRLACLTAQYYPYWPMGPKEARADYVACQAVGNTFRLCRTAEVKEATRQLPNEYGAYSDDGLISDRLRAMGFEVGFSRSVYCYNLELTEDNWGYTEDQLKEDPRKAGYTQPERYQPLDWETLAVPEQLRIG